MIGTVLILWKQLGMRLKKFEFWLSICAVLVYVFVRVFESVYSHPGELIGQYSPPYQSAIVFDYYKNFFVPNLLIVFTLFFAFLLLNNRIMPGFQKENDYLKSGLGAALVFAGVFIFISIAYSYLHYYHFANYRTTRGAYMQIWKEAFSFSLLFFILYAFYYLLRMTASWYYHEILRNEAQRKLFEEVAIAVGLWVAACLFIYQFQVYRIRWIQNFFLLLVPIYILFFFLWVYHYIPKRQASGKRRHILLPSLLILIGLGVPVMLLYVYSVRYYDEVIATVMCFVFGAGLLLVVWPISKWYFNQKKSHHLQIQGLQKVVTRKTADLDFLRSQINPHFLFNALNTIYGTALQENADRTAEGVQKLGDLMRFMLHENQQEKIPLDKEINYLQNYIDLQKLRTETSENIHIDFTVNDMNCNHIIAPMLLVPFVENAFKHGISLNEKSWIKISLSCDAERIYFDMYNSVHERNEEDPERDRSGIGLENVKQRLSLIYPANHELNIRQTSNEFFVHLTIKP